MQQQKVIQLFQRKEIKLPRRSVGIVEKTIICFQGAQTHKMKIKLKKPVIVTLVQFALTIRALKGEGGQGRDGCRDCGCRGGQGRGRAGRGNGQNKYACPHHNENNWWVIDGIIHIYNTSINQWAKQDANLAANSTPSAPPVTSVQSSNAMQTTGATSLTGQSNASHALANFAASMSAALNGLQDQL